MNDDLPAPVLYSFPRFLCRQVFSKCIIDSFNALLNIFQSLPVAHKMKTYILIVPYDALSDLSSACYFIFKSYHLPSLF